ncbi:MAG: hypothetical protein EB060_10075 [Proteobacteria bacterium]|nr:hypothetical protein [Pseudomonadota bacterium]
MQNAQAIERLFTNIAMMVGASGGAIYRPNPSASPGKESYVVYTIQDFRRDDFDFALNTMYEPDPMGYFNVPMTALDEVFRTGETQVLLHRDAKRDGGCLSCVFPVKNELGEVQFMMAFTNQLYDAHDIAVDSPPGEKHRGVPRSEIASARTPPVRLAFPHDSYPDQLIHLSEFVLKHGSVFESFGDDPAVNRVPYQEELELRVLEGIEERMMDFLRGFSPQTALHVERVAKLCDAFFDAVRRTDEGPYANVMLTDRDALRARLGAGMHDIGKMQVALSVTEFTGRYDDNYARAMRAHTTLGEGMINLPFSGAQGLADIAAQHHDRPWQGNQRFTSDLVKICDVFDALTCPRSYMKTYFVGGQRYERDRAPVEHALGMLFEMSQKDPPLIDPYALKFFSEHQVWRALGNPEHLSEIDTRYVLRSKDMPLVGPIPNDAAAQRDGMFPAQLTQILETVAENMLNTIWDRVRATPQPSLVVENATALEEIEGRISSTIGIPPASYIENIKKDPFFTVRDPLPPTLPPPDLGVSGDVSGAGDLGAEEKRIARALRIDRRSDTERFKVKYEPARDRDSNDRPGTQR